MASVDRVPAPDGEPLAPKDEALWLLQQLAPDQGLANLPVPIRLERALRWWPLQRSLDWIARRHPPLRSCFPSADGVPVRRVLPPELTSVPLEFGATTEESLRADVVARGAVPFALDREIPFRAHQLLLPDGGSVLVAVFHHIGFDAPSTPVFLAELASAYGAFAATGQPPADALPPPAWPGPDPAPSQASLEWWLRQLADVQPGAMRLHGARSDPVPATFGCGLVTHTLSAEAQAAVDRLRRGLRTSHNIAMLSGLFLLLAHHGAGPDMILATPVSTRRAPDDNRRIGYHLHTIPIRVRAEPGAGFAALADQVQSAFLQALEHYDVSYEALLPRLARDSADWRVPMFRHMFNYWTARSDVASIGGSPARLLTLDRPALRLDIEFSVGRVGDGFVMDVLYNTDIHDRWQAEVLAERYDVLLRRAAEDPGCPIADLRPWSDRDVAVVTEANRTTHHWREHHLLDLFGQQARREPGAVAIVNGDEQVTYAALTARAEAVAAELRSAGVRPGEVVALAEGRGVAAAAAVLGVWLAGAAYLPLDPAHPDARLAFQLDDAGVRTVIGGQLPAECLAGRRVLEPGRSGGSAARPAPPPVVRDGEALAYLIYTSGSTGPPKAVEVPHRALRNVVGHFARLLEAGRDDVFLWLTTLAFDISALELLLPLSVGASVVVAPDEAQTQPDVLLELASRHRATVIQATPTVWRQVAPASGWRRPGMRILCGGEPMSPALARRLLGTGARLFNVYGPTETTIWSTCAEIVPPVDGEISVGRPISNTSVHLIGDRGVDVPPGLPGELCIGGAGVTRGYRARPRLTADRFRVHPGNRRLYHTGDMARWRPDGTLVLLGRRDRQVKLRGHRIELGEVEAALEAHPEVTAAAVVLAGQPDADGRLVAIVQAAFREGLENELWAHARSLLPSYALPAAIRVVAALPGTPNGKVDYQALAEESGDLPAGRPGVVAAGPPGAAPGSLAARILELWRDLLGDPTLTDQSNFFLHGGHSLLAAKLVRRVEEATGVRVGLVAVFQAPTAAEFTRLIEP
jgi:amino acid adenylation domain-containing protein